MDNNVWAKKILGNLCMIKERVSLALDIVVDNLIEKGVVPFSIKQELDGFCMPSSKMDHLIHILIKNGQSACETFVESLTKNGLKDIADKIKGTKIENGFDNYVAIDVKNEAINPSEEAMTKLNIPSDSGDENNDTGRKKSLEERISRLETQTAREKKEMYKDIEGLKKRLYNAERKNEDLCFEKNNLDFKFKSLQNEFSIFQIDTMQGNAERNRQLEQLKRKNKMLLNEFETMKRRLETREKENEELKSENKQLKFQLDEKTTMLQFMISTLQKSEYGKVMIKQVKGKSNTVKLPPIRKGVKTRAK